MLVLISLCTSLLLANLAFAHPGHNVADEAAERAAFLKRKPRTIRSCASQLAARGHEAASLHRRHTLFNDALNKRQLVPKSLSSRDFAGHNISHALDDSSTSGGSIQSSLFTDNSSCILQPEVTQGPYYVNGELIRQNLTEGQEGVFLILEIQLIDTSTCEPVPAMFVDLWHCNSTGVYSGVKADGNGNGDASNLNTTFLRGIQQSDLNGVVQFHTLVPGHYTGRTNHIHILAHAANDTRSWINGTLLSSNATTVHASHIGQLFFDQSLLTQVESTYPYIENAQNRTYNSDDLILGEEADGMDPFVEYVMLGGKIENGLLAWITIGIDPAQNYEVATAATHYESGGVANQNSMEGSPPGNGTDGGSPSGVLPDAAASATAAQ